jgi:hypothetical protein
VLRQNFLIEDAGDLVRVSFRSSRIDLQLDQVSAALLGLLDGTRSFGNIVSAIARELELKPSTVRRRVRALVRELAANRLLDLYRGQFPPPLKSPPYGTVLLSEVDAEVRYRMGRFHEPAQLPNETTLSADRELNKHLLLRFHNGRLATHPDLPAGSRESLFLHSLLALDIPKNNFRIIFSGDDRADQHPNVPIHGHFRVTGSDATILWPLAGYTALGADIFGFDIGRHDRPWEQKIDKAVWRGTSTGTAIHGMSIDEIDALIDRPFAATDSVGNRIVPKANRLQLVSRYYGAACADIGLSAFAQIDAAAQDYFRRRGFLKPPMPIEQILSHKYIIVVDGNSFASQLPWSLHCQSLVLMVPPAWESIISGVTAWEHYVPLEADFSDLVEKIEWCRRHNQRCRRISAAASELMRRYYHPGREQMIQQHILERYAELYSAR